MKTEEIIAIPQEEAERLAEGFVRFYGSLEGPEGVVAPQALFDINVPTWRFQVEGPEAFVEWLKGYTSSGYQLSLRHVVPTSEGFVAEIEGTYEPHGHELYFRNLIACRVTGGLIDEVIYYCTGDWDPETRSHHTHEVKLVRP
jgi:hypothetical protein